MMLQPVTSTRYDANDAVSDIVTLYNSYGAVVGMWSKRNGRAMLGDAFYVNEQPQDAIRLGTVRDNGYGTVSLDGTD